MADKTLDQALDAIWGADLQHPDGELLECFLQDAIDPGAAASYFLERLENSTDTDKLLGFLTDWERLLACYFTPDLASLPKPSKSTTVNIWKRDGGKCRITGYRNSLLDRLVVVPVLPAVNAVPDDLYELLAVFVGSDMQQRIITNDTSLYDERKPLAGPYFCRRGNVTGLAGLPIHQPRWGTMMPEMAIIETLSRFSKAIRWSLVAKEIRERPFSATAAAMAAATPTTTIQWHNWSCAFHFTESVCSIQNYLACVPSCLRLQVYLLLFRVGCILYEPSYSMNVQRLPFGLYLKARNVADSEALENEYRALQLVRRYTEIPTPRPIDLVSDSKMTYMVTTRLPGERLGTGMDFLTNSEAETLVDDLHRCIQQLRCVPKDFDGHQDAKSAICNARGKECFDFRLNSCGGHDPAQGNFDGPFTDEEAFNKFLQTAALPGLSHRGGHAIVFTHSDLNLRNVLVHNGRFSGIVDWENAGWFPEYWDQTKAHFVTKRMKRWLRMVDAVFQRLGNYEEELAIERQYWFYCM